MPDCAMSFEAHPANTSVDHLQALYDEGFRRLSLGIQDFDAKVQDAIHRFQSVQQVEYITLKAREIGFVGINYDLVYGLPFQNIQGLSKTLEEVIRLKPDRIAFYSYAHVPWLKPGQRKYTELDLPDASLKMELYHLARNKFEYHGYLDVGMDHFALAHDDLAIAYLNHSLHRNFMGYTDRHTRLLIGLGTSSISDSWYAFAQNEKTVEQYLERVTARKLPVFKGHLLNREDLIIRRHILNIMCKGETHWDHFCTDTDAIHQAIPVWREMEQEGLLHLSSHGLKVSKSGMNFLRNICMALDARHHRALSSSPKYSRAI
jgi:oxygen-independent coproporphyrinogen-3 oxidase